MKRAVLFILGVITLFAMTSCAGGASGGGRAAGERNALFANGALTVNITGDSGFSRSGSTTLDSSGSGTLTIKSVPVGITVLAEASITANGITYTGSTTATTVEGTTPVTITVRPDSVNLTIPADADTAYMDALLAKLTDGQTYTLTIGNLTSSSVSPDTLIKKLAGRTDCYFNIVIGSGYVYSYASAATGAASRPFTTGSGDVSGGIPNIISVDLSQNTTITSIGSAAFKGCSGLTSITLPSSVTSIGESAFENCSGLAGITLPSGIGSIAQSVFKGCSSLTGITLPSSVISIGESAFQGCSSLTSIDLTNIASLGNYAFYGSGLTSVTIPAAVENSTGVPAYCFKNCTNLTEISIHEKGKFMTGSFENCINLSKITVTGPNAYLGGDNAKGSYTAFRGCTTTPIEFDLSACSGSVEIQGGYFGAPGEWTIKISEIKLSNSLSSSSVTIKNLFESMGTVEFPDTSGTTRKFVRLSGGGSGNDSFAGALVLIALFEGLGGSSTDDPVFDNTCYVAFNMGGDTGVMYKMPNAYWF